jgi:hypothetical protein
MFFPLWRLPTRGASVVSRIGVTGPYRSNLAARLARFEASIARLESNRRQFAQRRPLYLRSLTALAVAGFACFAFGPFVGLWGSISASVVSLAGYGMLRLRSAELTSEIDTLRVEAARMRGRPTQGAGVSCV